MKFSVLKSICFFSLFFFQSISTINIRYIKDTYTILKPEYKQLSPAHGFVWWEQNIVRNIYTYGLFGDLPSFRKGPDGSSYPPFPYGTVQLVRLLFHEVQGSFNLTRAPGNPAHYFSPGTVGRLLGVLENARTSIELIGLSSEKKQEKIKKVAVIQKTLHEKLLQTLGADEGYKEGVRAYYQSVAAKPSFQEKHRYFLRYQKRVITAIVASLEESGFFDVSGKSETGLYYPPFTTYSILLTFLSRKAENIKQNEDIGKADYKEYFNGLQEVIQGDIFTQQGRKLFESQSWLQDVYNDSEKGINSYLNEIELQVGGGEKLSASLVDQLYEKMVFAELSRPKGFPDLAQYRKSQYEGIKFSDCVDTTVRNLCNIVLFDEKTNTFTLSMLKKGKPNAACTRFYSDPIVQNAAEIENPKVHNAWTNVVENQFYVSYNRMFRKSDKVELCCAGTLKFHGFLRETDALKKKASNKVTLTFNDGKSETFDLLEMNGRRFVLVDPQQYALFEIMPSLKNIIVLMNELFGLQLYENIETVFFEETFNTTYFPDLADTFDWNYKQPAMNLDQGDYDNIEISVNTLAGSFQLKLDLDLINDRGHGQLILLNKTTIESYQEKLLQFCIDQFVTLPSNKELLSHSFLINVYALYQLSNFFQLEVNTFKNTISFLNFTFYSQRLDDPDVMTNVIRVIVENKLSFAYDLCALLIERLPAEGDLTYLKNLARLNLKQVVGSKGQQQKIMTAVTRTFNSLLQKQLSIDILFVMRNFVEKDMFLNETSQFLQQVLNKTIHFDDHYFREAYIALLVKLIDKGKAFELGIEYAKNPNFKEDNLMPLLVKLIDKGKAFELGIEYAKNPNFKKDNLMSLYKSLTAQGQGLKEATRYAEQSFENDSSGGFSLFEELFKKGHGYQEAISLAQKLLKDSAYINKEIAVLLFERLLPYKQGYKEALEAAQQLNEGPRREKILAYNLMTMLVEAQKYYPEAIAMALEGLGSVLDRLNALELFEHLFKKGQGFKQAIEVARKNKNVSLFKLLIDANQGYQEAIEVAQEMMKGKNRDKGVELLQYLVEHGQGYQQAIENAQKLLTVKDYRGENPGLMLFKALFSKKQGFDEAIQRAQELFKQQETRHLGFRIFELMVENEQGYAQAIQAAQEACASDQYHVQFAGLTLFKKLVEKGQAHAQAKEVADRLSKSDKEGLVIKAKELKELLSK